MAFLRAGTEAPWNGAEHKDPGDSVRRPPFDAGHSGGSLLPLRNMFERVEGFGA